MLSIGNFVTPDLLGGGKLQMVGNLIYDQFLTARDWPFGAALAFVLIGLMMLLLVAAGLGRQPVAARMAPMRRTPIERRLAARRISASSISFSTRRSSC